MNQHKNRTKVVQIEIDEELHQRHMAAAEKIIDIIMEYCDGPPDALYLLKKMAEKLCRQYGMLDAIDEPAMQTDKVQ